VGQGDAVWERFGHNAIWIQDAETGRGTAYNWGIFDFRQANFFSRLVKGEMLYKMAPVDPFASLEEYRQANRRVWIQELALTPDQKLDLLTFVEWNALPENRDYRYDYYRDNCSTRVRDALDRVLGGALRRNTRDVGTPHTYRWHTRRLLQDVAWAYTGIQVVLGPRADAPLSAWEEMFLPLRLMDRLRDVRVPDPESPDGGLRPLVAGERLFLESDRSPMPPRPPFRLPWFLLLGVSGGGIMVALTRGKGELGRGRRLGLTVFAGGWALVASLAGLLLAGAWLFTDHVFWYQNYNLSQMSPLFLPLPLAFLLFLFRGRFPRWGRDVALVLAGLAVMGFLVELVPGLGQANGEILALSLPLNLALAWTGMALRERTRTDTEERAPRRNP
jgi:hypothetical protein